MVHLHRYLDISFVLDGHKERGQELDVCKLSYSVVGISKICAEALGECCFFFFFLQQLVQGTNYMSVNWHGL